jgi:hypothetical protein
VNLDAQALRRAVPLVGLGVVAVELDDLGVVDVRPEDPLDAAV